MGDVLRILVALRYQFAAAAFLVLLPWGSLRTPARGMLANLFTVTAPEAACVGALATLLAWVVMVTSQLAFRLACEGGRPPGAAARRLAAAGDVLRPYRVAVFALLALPVIAALAGRSATWGAALGAVGGIPLAWVVLAAASILYGLLLPPREPSSGLLLDLAIVERAHRVRPALPAAVEGWAARLNRRFSPGHLLCLSLFGCFFAVYVAVGLLFRPDGPLADGFPALGYVLLLAILATWLLTGAAFWLDRYRVPPLAALAAVSFAGYFVAATDHYYRVAPVPARLACRQPQLPPARALEAWRAALPPDVPPRMTVVAISGGGIAAAAWTARVLTGLEEEVGPAFNRSLVLLSAVSGGSLGALYYLDRFTRTGGTLEGRQAVRTAAAASSLRQIAWGVAYPDVWRLLFAPLLHLAPALDRGWAAEVAWRAHLREPRAGLRDWRGGVAAGSLPVAIFNATVVESGNPMLFTPVDLGAESVFAPFDSFHCLYPERDVELVTAARLSASFPFVSPIARPSDEVDGGYGWLSTEPGYHVADGGYRDNFGVTPLVAWLDAVLPAYVARGGGEVLVVEIRGFDSRPARRARRRAAAERGWLYALAGPLTTLMNVRSSAQSVHGAEELRLLRALWEERGVRFTAASFALDEESPLSWQLAPAERRRIDAVWRRATRGEDLAAVRAFHAR